MVEPGGVPGLQLEALEQPLVPLQLAAQQLEGDHLAERHLLGLVDVAHGAGADQLEHAEVGPDDAADDLAGHPSASAAVFHAVFQIRLAGCPRASRDIPGPAFPL